MKNPERNVLAVLETTICNEIPVNHEFVVIDDVDNDSQFRAHHTPRLCGFKSYISVPIILKNGDFFGTLCAIDPKPASLNNIKQLVCSRCLSI